MPPWLRGTSLTLTAHHHQRTGSCKDQAGATPLRCGQRTQRIARPQHRAAAQKPHRRPWDAQDVAAVIALGEIAQRSLEHLATTNEPLKKRVKTRLALQDDYGGHALLDAMHRAPRPQAFGAHALEPMLSHELPPQRQHPPGRLPPRHLHPMRLAAPALEAYDACVIPRQQA